MNERHIAGFSLLELLIALVVAAILAGLMLPAFQGFLTGQRLETRADRLVRAIDTARTNAISTDAPVTLCKLNMDGDGCDSAPGDWSNGWRISRPGTLGDEFLAQDRDALTVTLPPDCTFVGVEFEIPGDDPWCAAFGLAGAGGSYAIYLTNSGRVFSEEGAADISRCPVTCP